MAMVENDLRVPKKTAMCHVTRIAGDDLYGHEIGHCYSSKCSLVTEMYVGSMPGADSSLVEQRTYEIDTNGKVIAEVL